MATHFCKSGLTTWKKIWFFRTLGQKILKNTLILNLTIYVLITKNGPSWEKTTKRAFKYMHDPLKKCHPKIKNNSDFLGRIEWIIWKKNPFDRDFRFLGVNDSKIFKSLNTVCFVLITLKIMKKPSVDLKLQILCLNLIKILIVITNF